MRKAVSFIFCLGTILILVLTLISFSPFQSQSFDIFDHLRLHYFVCAGFAFLVFLWLKKPVWLSLALLVLLSNGFIFYSSFSETLAQTGKSQYIQKIKLLNFNAYFGNEDSNSFIDLVRKEKPDVIILEEFLGISEDVVNLLKSDYRYSGPFDETTKRPNYIYIFSKFPFELKSFKRWNRGDNNPPMAHGVLTVDDKKIELIAVHLHWPYNAQLKTNALGWLSNYLAPLKNPILLVGDFNLTSWSDALLKFSQENKLKKFGLFERSWPSKNADIYFPFAHLLIDHVFIRDSDLWKINKHRFEAGPSIGSDHLPMISEISLEKKK